MFRDKIKEFDNHIFVSIVSSNRFCDKRDKLNEENVVII